MEMNMGKFSEKLVELLELAKKKKNVQSQALLGIHPDSTAGKPCFS